MKAKETLNFTEIVDKEYILGQLEKEILDHERALKSMKDPNVVSDFVDHCKEAHKIEDKWVEAYSDKSIDMPNVHEEKEKVKQILNFRLCYRRQGQTPPRWDKVKNEAEKLPDINANTVIFPALNETKAGKEQGEVKTPMKCLGQKCVKTSRPNSKYCSEACGMELAKLRLKTILSDRVTEHYQNDPAMNEANLRKNQEMVEKANKLKKELEMSKELRVKLNEFINTYATTNEASESENKSVAEESNEKNSQEPADKNGNKNQENDFLVTCGICSKEVLSKNANKHFQYCFIKNEKQSTFGGPFPILGVYKEIYCNVQNKSDKTFCHRLKVMCPDHYIVKEREICAFPNAWQDGSPRTFLDLLENIDEIDDVCMRAQKECELHMGWGQRYLGMIDNEMKKILIQLDEIDENYHYQQYEFETRGDVLSLLLNHNIHANRPPKTEPMDTSEPTNQEYGDFIVYGIKTRSSNQNLLKKSKK
uniref:CXXC-type zinc finger protein 1 n=1 Tax=Acrobeloides nanus TaxID=290746 RepID=A0A914DMB7_9BILA